MRGIECCRSLVELWICETDMEVSSVSLSIYILCMVINEISEIILRGYQYNY